VSKKKGRKAEPEGERGEAGEDGAATKPEARA
jgi:hypothetical protein